MRFRFRSLIWLFSLGMVFLFGMHPQAALAYYDSTTYLGGNNIVFTKGTTTSYEGVSASGKFDYAIYDAYGELVDSGYNVTSRSYGIIQGFSMVISTSASTTINYDQSVSHSGSSSPAMYKTTLGVGSTVEVTNPYGVLGDIYTTGATDYVRYNASGKVYTWGQKTTARSFVALEDERVVLTNKDTSAITVAVPSGGANISSRTNPAVLNKSMSPGQSVDLSNNTAGSFSVSFTGTYDYSTSQSGTGLTSYGRKVTLGSKTLNVGEPLAVTNTGTTTGTIVAPYDILTVSTRSYPVSFTKALGIGQSMQATNTSTKTLNLYMDGIVDTARYTKTGTTDGFSRKSSSTSVSTSPGDYIQFTNRDSKTVNIVGPNDAMSIADRSAPALAIKSLAVGQTASFTNLASNSWGLAVGGKYDAEIFDDAGVLSTATRSGTSTAPIIYSGDKYVLTNAATTSYEVYGPYDVTSVADRTTPALIIRQLAAGKSLEFTNYSGKTYNVTTKNKYDYASYKPTGSIYEHVQGTDTDANGVYAGEKMAITNTSTLTSEVWAPYDVFSVADRANPVTFTTQLSVGGSIKASNVSAYSFSLIVGGVHDYAYYNTSGQVDSYGRQRNSGTWGGTASGESVVFTNSGASAYTVSGAWDAFSVVGRAEPALFIKTVTPGQSLDMLNNSSRSYSVYEKTAKYDSADYKPDGSIYSYSRDNAAGSSDTVYAGEKFAYQNADTMNGEVWGPYDPFSVWTRTNPVTVKKAIGPGMTLRADNLSAYTFNLLPNGINDVVTYSTAGQVETVTHKDTGVTPLITGGESLVLTNADSSWFNVSGAYDAFNLTDRTAPALELRTLQPGQSVEYTNIGNKTYYLYEDGKGKYDKAFYTNGAINAYTRDSYSTSNFVNAAEKIAVQNTDSIPLEVWGAYDVFQVNSRTTPVSFLKTLGVGSSMKATNTSAVNFSVLPSGTQDYVTYTTDGDVSTSSRQHGALSVTVLAKQAIAITNSDVSPITVKGPYDAYEVVDRANPALFVRTIAPGQSVEATNIGPSSETLYHTNGIVDYATYKGGVLETYFINSSPTSHIISFEKKVAFTNMDAGNVDVWGPYDVFTTATRTTPVTFVKTLQPGESLKARNITGSTRNLRFDGLYDYTTYNTSGDLSSSNHLYSSTSFGVYAGYQMVITNTDLKPLTVKGSTDSFLLGDAQPSVFVKQLQPGESLEIISTADNTNDIDINGSYQKAFYNASGTITSYSPYGSAGSLSVGAYVKVAITNTDSEAITVTGPIDFFKTQSRSVGVAFTQQLAPGKSFQATNTTGSIFSVYLNGTYDYAKYKTDGSVVSYARGNTSTGAAIQVMPGERLVVTDAGSSSLTASGARDAFTVSTYANTALLVKTLQVGDTAEIENTKPYAYDLTVGGKYQYDSLTDGSESNRLTSTEYVTAGEHFLLTNIAAAAYDIYAPYEVFLATDPQEPDPGEDGGFGSLDELSSLDPSDADARSYDADPINTSTGSQIITKTLITANGSVPITFQVQYDSQLLKSGTMGSGWGHNYETSVEPKADGSLVLHWNANRQNQFTSAGNGLYKSTDASVKQDQLLKNADGTFTLIRKDGIKFLFDAAGKLTRLQSNTGQGLNLTYTAQGQLSSVVEPVSGQSLYLGYTTDGLLQTVTDMSNRQVVFGYDTQKRLNSFLTPGGDSWTYTYDAANRILTGSELGVRKFSNTYDSSGRIITQVDAKSKSTQLSYDKQPDKLVTTITNRDGTQRILTHDRKYQLVSEQDESGNITSYTYDSNGNRTGVVDPAGNRNTFTYDERGNLLTITDSKNQTVSMTYDGSNNLLSVLNAKGQTLLYTYDSLNNLISAVDPEHHQIQYAYDAGGRLQVVTDADGNKTTYAYDANGRPASITNAEGNTISYGYDQAGRVNSITDPSGKATLVTYDGDDRILSLTDPLSHTTTFAYDGAGNLKSQTDAKGHVTAYQYDNNDNLVKLIDALNHATTYEYDAQDRLIKETDALGHSATYSYNLVGQLSVFTDALGRSQSYAYDNLGQVTDVYDALGNRVSHVTYDAAGNPTSVIDGMNHISTQEYDDLNRLIKTTEPSGASTAFTYDNLNRLTTTVDALNGMSVQTYDNLGNVQSVIDPGQNATTYVYDKVGRLLNETNATGSHNTYNYDNRGLLKYQTNGRGQQTSFQYDDAGRLIAFTDPSGTVQYGYDENGNVVTVSENGKNIVRTYDELDRVTSYTDENGNTIQYQYDAVGHMTAMVYPDGKKVTYGYDAGDQLTSVTDWANRTTTYEYDLNGNLDRTVRADGSTELRSYDVNGRLTGVVDVAKNGSLLSNVTYTYDAAGDLVSEIDSVTGLTVPGFTPGDAPDVAPLTPLVDATMTYTSDNRLATFNGLPVNYDADGNLLTVPMNGMLQDFQYDARNRLISAGGYTYTYNAENIRTAVSGNGKTTKFVVNPQSLYSQVLMETDEQGNIIARYVYGLGLVGREAVDGSYSVYHYDRRGSTTSLTNASGELTDTYMYGPYGELMDHQGTTENHFLYNGRYGVVTDPNGLYYMRARYYSPEIKRFVNRDVVNGNVVDGQSMNHFAFVNGNPITGVDPFGLSRDGDDSTLSKAGDTVLDFIPWVGTIKGFQQAFTGTNYVTGQTLSTGDRWAEGIGSVTGLIPIPGAKIGGKYLAKGAFALFGGFVKQEAKEEAKQEVKRGITLNLQLFAANKAADEVVQQVTRRQAFREAKRAAGIPVSAQFLKHGYVYDGTSENRTVYEFLVDGKSKYIILHEEDKMGRGPHFHGADDSKGNPFDKGRYQQYEGHFPEDFGGFI